MPVDLGAWMEKALASRPELEAARSALEGRRVELLIARERAKPSLDAVASYDRFGLAGVPNPAAAPAPGAPLVVPPEIDGGWGRSLGALGDVLRRLGDADRAIDCFEASLELRRQTGDRIGEGWMLQRLALAHAAGGAAAGAGECAAGAARIAAETDNEELAAACRELPHALGR